MHMSCLSAQSGAADEYKNINIELECFEQTAEIDVHGEAMSTGATKCAALQFRADDQRSMQCANCAVWAMRR